MSDDLPAPRDWRELTEVIGAVVNPLAQQQATTQQRAIDADVEKFRVSVEAQKHLAKFSFTLSLLLLVVVAAVMGAFIFAGQYQLAFNALSFAGGALAGYGVGRARKAGP